MIDFAAIKARHRIEDVLARRGEVLNKVSGGFATRCPVHGGEKPRSLFIHAGKQWCKCWTECGYIGSVLDLVMALDGAATPAAAAEILEGRPLTEEERSRPRPAPRAARLRFTEERETAALPKFYRGERRHFEVIAAARGLPWETIQMAHDAGHLRFCQAGWRDGQSFNCYAILDMSHPVNVQFRRMDADAAGKALPFWDDVKVMGWKGNRGGWPVGLDSLLKSAQSRVVLVEGTGDFLAAWYLRDLGCDVIPVAMFGATQSIPREALPFFERREVIIIEQHDESGARAAAKWQEQLQKAGAKTAIRRQVPDEGGDLNDLIRSRLERSDFAALSAALKDLIP